MFGHSYSFDSQVAQDFPAGSSLHIVNDRGAVNLNVSTDGKLHVAAHKRVNADNQQDADKWNAGSNPTIVVSGQLLAYQLEPRVVGHYV